jgi:hypothetical protein
MMAPLTLDGSAVLPSITMVFAAMENVKDWRFTADGGGRAAKARRRAVQRIIRDVLTRTLVASPGSYLCRLQEDEFKYMAAFPSPEVRALFESTNLLLLAARPPAFPSQVVRVSMHGCALFSLVTHWLLP